MNAATDIRPVLIVEDDEASAELQRRVLHRAGFSPMVAGSLSEAKTLLIRGWFHALLLDYRLPDGDAWDLVSTAQNMNPPVPVVLATAAGSEAVAAEAVIRGVAEYLRKADDFAERLPGALERATRQGRAHQELRRNDSLFRTIADNASDAILLINHSGLIEFGSAAALKLFTGGQDGLQGRRFLDFVHPDDSPFCEPMQGNRTFRCRRADGTHAVVEPIFSKVGKNGEARTLAVLRDVTERTKLEERLLHQQRMEAVGQLTGGLAHDFNNLLAVMIGNLDYLRELLKDNPEALICADDALEAALLGTDLTRRLLTFSRRRQLLPERTDLNKAIESIIRLLDRTLGQHIKIDLALAPFVWPVFIDKVQLETAITNLATNARDAMPRGGRLLISTRNDHLDADYAADHPDVLPGDFAVIEVSDTGTGIGPDIIGRIFEPFFTTKEPGHGTGVGLSMVFGFVKQSGGHINVYSEPGKGTIFRLYFRRADQDNDGERAAAAEHMAPGAGTTILLVEDNSRLRQVTLKQLTGAGYRVLEADNGRAAIGILDSLAPIDLLFSDIVMPGEINGHDLARLAQASRPGLRTILTSGFPETHGGAVPTGWRMLTKPYRKEVLLATVREVLEAPPPHNG